ncbi:MAG: hypothetical protein M0D57_16665 [Sphingobacteriales bacterium JAD_PAG50586_3]|nr:MAG: hypothetical protein M0D57_16665 [Sphingobacteriales bacterium JAD_PAG50586_3]
MDSYSENPLDYKNEYVEEIILADKDTIFKTKIDIISGNFTYKQSPKLNLGISIERREHGVFKNYQITYCGIKNTKTMPEFSVNIPINGKFSNYDFKQVGGYASNTVSYVKNRTQWLMSNNSLSEKHRIDVIYKSMIRDNCPNLHPDKITFVQNISNYNNSKQYTYSYNW